MPLAAFSSLGGAGGASASSSAAARSGDSNTGAINIGGLNVPALPSQTNTLVLAAAGIVIAFLFLRQKR